jgi:phage terminase small subunit
MSTTTETIVLTPKQEAFAMAYVECGNASAAYRECYDVDEDTKPSSIWVRASELLSHSRVSVRIQQLRDEMKQAHKVSTETVHAMTMAAYEKAMDEDKGASAAISGAALIAKLHGLITDKSEQAVTATVKQDAVDRPPRATREEWIARKRRDAGTVAAVVAATRPAN